MLWDFGDQNTHYFVEVGRVLPDANGGQGCASLSVSGAKFRMKRMKARDNGPFGQHSLKCTCTSTVAMIADEDQRGQKDLSVRHCLFLVPSFG